jgi:hypothetical protein
MATMTPKSIVDAKGDLIAATANDTPARLAVGGDYGFLQALASASTGLQWNSNAWTTYTPTIAPDTGSFTTASANGSYIRIGKLCVLRLRGLVTTVGTGTNPNFTLPFTAVNSGAGTRFTGIVRENAVTGNAGTCTISPGGTVANVFRYDNASYVGSGFDYSIMICYEVA